MSNLTTMIQRIADEVDDSGIDDQIEKAIRSAIKFHERRRFYFNQKTFTFTTVTNQEYYDLDDAADIETFLDVMTQNMSSGGVNYPLTVTDFQYIDECQTGSVTGRPTNWAFFAQKFRLYPLPDAAYTITVAGHCRLVTLDTSNPSNAWMTDGEELIRQAAKRRIAMDVTKEPTDAQAAQVLEAEALDGLIRETKLRRGRMVLRVDPALLSPATYDINVE